MKKYFTSFLWVINHPNNRNNSFLTILRIFIWKMNQVFLKIPKIINIQNGVKFKCYPDSSWGGLVIYTRLPEYFEMRFVNKIINKGDIVIDVGANLGSYSLIAASKVSNGKVFAFEPSKVAYKRLLENITLNNMNNKIKTFRVVVSDKEGNLDFNDLSRPEVSHVSYSPSQGSTRIRSVTLDEFVRRQKIKKIRLIKVDVEGYEYRVLKGASEILRKGIVDFLLIEINRDSLLYNIDSTATFKFIKSLGYKTYYFRNSMRLTPISKIDNNKKTVNIIAINKNIQIQ